MRFTGEGVLVHGDLIIDRSQPTIKGAKMLTKFSIQIKLCVW